MTYTVRPISDRTQFTGKHEYSNFTVTWSQAEQLLLDELARVRARNAVMELDVTEGQLRLDGRPKATARVASRAVRVIFETPDGATLTFATDRFVSRYYNAGMRENWQHNVYAIAKGLEALRMMKRYGIVEADQQYAGFKALPGGRAMPAAGGLIFDDAALIVSRIAYPDAAEESHAHVVRSFRTDADAMRATIKRAKFNAHPDRRGGDHTMWNALAPALTAIGAA